MDSDSTYPRVLIVGLGNELLMDDGVGVHAVRELEKDPPKGVAVAEVGTAILNALHLLEAADVVIAIDAVQGGDRPGTIYRFGAGEAESQDQRLSLHDLGLIGALRLLPEDTRPEVAILGVEPEKIGYGMELSAAVAAALPRVAEAARTIAAEIAQRGRDSGPSNGGT